MKRLIFILILLINYAYAQDVDYTNLSRRVYWFDISVRYEKVKGADFTKLNVRRYGTTIKYGNVEQFDKHLWNNLSAGKGIAVGPFNTYEEAKYANRFYDLKKAEQDSVILNDNNTYYWYLVKVKKYKRMNSLDFERIPARVASGKADFFFQTLKNSLTFDKVAIGPFTSYEEAEESKRLFRLEE